MEQLRMTVCIMIISVVAGGLTAMVFLKANHPILITSTAINIAMLVTFYKPEFKKLYEKIFGDDDFKGGNFG